MGNNNRRQLIMKRQYTIYNICVLLALLFLGGGNRVWGQRIIPTYPDNNENSSRMGRSTEVIYATKGYVTIKFQENDVADCIDGFVRWYVENDNGNESTTDIQGTYNNADNGYRKFDNGFVWVNPNGTTVAPNNINSISYDYDGSSTVTVVCEGSSIYNSLPDYGNWTSPEVSIQRRYIIKPAKERAEDLDERNDYLSQEIGSDWRSDSDTFQKLINSTNRDKYYLDNYEIHVPLGRNVTFRLSEKLSNYFVPVQTSSGWGGGTTTSYIAATSVRWNVFNASGSRTENTAYEDVNEYKWTTNISSSTAIWENADLNDNATQTQIFYLVAEVRYNNVSYPASFIKLYVEPNSAPLTESQLTTIDTYEHRTTEYLEQQGFINIANLNFDDIDGDGNDDLAKPTAANNFAEDPMPNANSYYAYAYPGEFLNRKNRRLSVGRQEYGLYRTLNMDEVSRSEPIRGGDGHNQRIPLEITRENYGVYNEYFTANKGNANYNRIVVDKTYAANDYKGNAGFFLYIDAADEPGVITNIRMDDRLCNDMRLVVTAWVCDMSASDAESNRIYADLGLTFKGVREGQETVLNRYFSGEIGRPESDSGDGGYALWQQIYFTFNYSGTEEDYNYFILEISNNSRGSNGADYAIDNIQVWRSTPSIQVQRLDACDASTLTISSDYETILRNMDWEAETLLDVSSTKNTALAKYRLGLHGARNDANYPQNVDESYVGNTYFAFIEGLKEDEDGTITAGTDITPYDNPNDPLSPLVITNKGTQHRWVNVNKGLAVDVPISRYSFRVAVSTNAHANDNPNSPTHWPTNQADAIRAEKVLNLRAVQDYNYAVRKSDNEFGYTPDVDPETGSATEIDLQGLTEDNVWLPEKEDTYLAVAQELYSRLKIPRIRSPWVEEETGLIHLYTMDVTNTDLKFEEELVGYDNDNNPVYADGKYHVILLGAQEVDSWVDSSWEGGEKEPINLEKGCLMMSSFTVYGSVVIRVTTTTDADALVCLNTQRKVSATLVSTEGKQLQDNQYSFDWYLGRREAYEQLEYTVNSTSYDLKGAIEYFRSDPNNNLSGTSFTRNDVNNWETTDATSIKQGLLNLFDQDLLRIDTKEFNLVIQSDTIVAMPFIVPGTTVNNRLYCTEIASVGFNELNEDVPEIYPGLSNVSYPPTLTNVPVRLGLRHLAENMELTIPLRRDIRFSMDREDNTGHVLKELTSNTNILLYDVDEEGDLPTIGTVKELFAEEEGTGNHLTMVFTANASSKITAEGQTYTLLVPFGEYASEDAESSIGAACDGLAQLVIKIVPEYLTWKGGNTGVWYNDEQSWTISTKEELYNKDDVTNTTEGVYSFSPLYFTKITIPEGKELPLYDEASWNSIETNTPLDFSASGMNISGTTDDIEYDMAVYSTDGGTTISVEPYYGNLVSEIYFKPNASLYRQDYLTYKKAWVDFEMEANTPYWMSAPLQDVYAGDMYAPSSNGRQETEAFTDITYNGKFEDGTDLNSRWSPAFYQKAWDKAIAYVTEEGDMHSEDYATDVAAVKSNWSIEYNDVWVPYSKGKGFYARVEDLPKTNTTGFALVRLPKADTEYSYETRAASNLSGGDNISRTNANRLWGNTEIATKGNVTVDLSTVDGDNEHFLIGNPYMGYLKMTGDGGFLKANNDVLENKFWTLDRTNGSIVVGTPDVEWEGTDTDGQHIDLSTVSYVAPMTAFFVELKKEATSKEIKFTTSMIVQKPADGTENVYTKSYSATNPTLTITAERGETKSVAKLVTSDTADNGYETSEDAVVLLDSELDAAMVYTVSGSRAAQVNAMKEISNVGLGIYNENDDEATVTISGLSQMASPLYLYDAQTRKSVELEGGSYTMQITGDSHGRYYLRNSAMADELENTISIYSAQRGQVIVSALQPVKEIKVFNVSGALVRQFSVNTTQYTFPIQSGLYIIYASDGEQEQTEKVIVR